MTIKKSWSSPRACVVECASPPAARQSALARRRLALSVRPACRLRSFPERGATCLSVPGRSRYERRPSPDFVVEYNTVTSVGLASIRRACSERAHLIWAPRRGFGEANRQSRTINRKPGEPAVRSWRTCARSGEPFPRKKSHARLCVLCVGPRSWGQRPLYGKKNHNLNETKLNRIEPN
jgi:hypothetical protein